jgi:glycosyltransferase involved in cell wall biosynthesis
MRISLVTETFFPQVNGVSRTLGQLVRVLEEAGDTVQVIQPDYGEPAPEGKARHLVRSINPPFYRELYVPLPPFGPVKRALDDFKPDIVHVATEATMGLMALRHVRRRGWPVVSSFHTNFDQYAAHYRIGWMTGTVWRYLRWFHNRTLETYVPSRATIAELETRGLERLVLWPRGVDATFFRPDRPNRDALRARLGFGPDDVVIAHVSRIAAEKNVAYLGAALERVEASRPSARLLIVGDGPARPALEKTLGPRAAFVGYRTGDDLADHYAASDVFAFASLTETFGNVVLEAMASGLPVVAVRAGGPGDIVSHGETGFLVEPDQKPEAFADALLRQVDDATLRNTLSRNARSHAESQSWDAIMLGLRDRYAAILNTNRA